MALNNETRKLIPEGAVILETPNFDNAIIGTTFDGRIIYSYELMIEELQTDNDWSENEAIEWINYNTIRALPYMGEKAPIIVSCYET